MKPGKRFGLSAEQKLDVWRRWKAGQTLHEIGRAFSKEHSSIRERAVSTVSREVARHGGRPAYRASPADGEAWQSALRAKRCLLSINRKLRNLVASNEIHLSDNGVP